MSKRFILLFSSIIIVLSSISLFAQAPAITTQPSDQGVIEGQTATFFVEASGDTLSYQWYKDGVLIGGATDSMYTTPATVLADNGAEFSVAVTNSHGTDSSNAATLYVTATGSRVTAGLTAFYDFNEGSGTTILDNSGFGSPLDLTINNPSAASWTSAGLFVKDTALINSSVATKIINAVAASNEITLELWIRPVTMSLSKIFNLTNYNSSINFNIEQLTSNYNVNIRTTNTDSLGGPGTYDTSPVLLNVTHFVFTFKNGITKIYRDGIEVMSANIGGNLSNWNAGARLSLASELGGGLPWKGIFYLAAVYSRALDSVEVAHNFASGDTVDHAPIITDQPQGKKISEGTTATFNVAAIGDATLSYQWQKNGTDISGATNSSYTTPATTPADSGDVFRVIVTNSSGSDTSQGATLEVVAAGLAGTPKGMTHYYKFEESTPPYIDSFGFTNATSSTPPTQTAGLVGNAQSFSGTEKVDIPDDDVSDWESNASFTLEFWMNTTATPPDVEVMIGRNDATSTVHWWVGYNPDGRASFQLRDINSEGALIGDKGPLVNDGSWHLITAVRDGSLGKNYLYIDGSKIDSASQTYTASFDGSVAVNIGYLNVAPYYYYVGLLDEVALYNVALSQSEIQKHYNFGLDSTGYNETVNAPTNLVAIKSVADTTNVDLSWADSSSNELGFVIQRALGDTNATSYSNIDTVGANVTMYTDTTVSDTTTYTYRVYAYTADAVSGYSNKAQITTAVPVELTLFTANISDGKVILNWQTATEINNSGFSIQRSSDNVSFTEIAFIRGHGTTTDKSVYSYTDNSALSGKYYYRLKQVDFNGSYSYTSSVEVNIGIPKNFSLDQNYPNPFNPSTTIRFALPTNARVNIKLYNTLGQEVVKILNNEQMNAGVHETIFNASNFSSGVYFYRLEAKGDDGSTFAQTKRMVLIK